MGKKSLNPQARPSQLPEKRPVNKLFAEDDEDDDEDVGSFLQKKSVPPPIV